MGNGELLAADLAVIGGGAAGLSVAAGAAQLGAKVVLIEKHKMGGECLNYGCVPSKALLAAAHAAQTIRSGGTFGVNGHEPEIDYLKVRGHVRRAIAAIEPHDSIARFEGLGVKVLQAPARFTGRDEIAVGARRVRARRVVIATGSSPLIPPIPGLETASYLTNETVFELDARPERLLVIGGGPIGIELAQAHRRLGCQVTVLEAGTILPKDDPEAVAVVRNRLVAEGVELRERTSVQGVARHANGVAVTISRAGGPQETLTGAHVLVAAGRRPNVLGLDLEAAGVAYGPKGIAVDRRLRTSNKRIFAIGDVIGGPQFTHMAGHHAGIVIRNALFRLPARVRTQGIPWVTYSDPELAQVGLGEAAARERHGSGVRATLSAFAENDRAQAEGASDGFVKVVTDRRGHILGTTIVGTQAGELILPWVLAIDRGLKIRALANLIAPYPTRGEASKRAGGAYFAPTLFSARTRRIVGLLQRLG